LYYLYSSPSVVSAILLLLFLFSTHCRLILLDFFETLVWFKFSIQILFGLINNNCVVEQLYLLRNTSPLSAIVVGLTLFKLVRRCSCNQIITILHVMIILTNGMIMHILCSSWISTGSLLRTPAHGTDILYILIV
jgi:hypothetical protein